MKLNLILILVAISLSSFSLLDFCAPVAEKAHFFCNENAPESEFREHYAAIVCGTSLTDPAAAYPFRASGLIHIIVVSGAHLIFLMAVCRKLKLPGVPILIAYSLATNLAAPCIRALVALGVRSVNNRWNCFWTPLQEVMIAGLVTWCMRPGYSSTLSFLLSWACALAISSTNEDTHPLKRHLIIYLLLLPILLPMGAAHPLSILFNYFLAPALGVILFPLSGLSFLFPPLAIVTDFLWDALIQLLEFTTADMPMIDPVKISRAHLWILIWTLFLILNSAHIYRKRKQVQ